MSADLGALVASPHFSWHGLLVLLAVNTRTPDRCPQDALGSMAEFFDASAAPKRGE